MNAKSIQIIRKGELFVMEKQRAKKSGSKHNLDRIQLATAILQLVTAILLFIFAIIQELFL